MTDVVKLIQRRITPLDSEKGKINITRTFHRDDYKSLLVSQKYYQIKWKTLNKNTF